MNLQRRWLALSALLASSVVVTIAAAAVFPAVTISKTALRGEDKFVDSRAHHAGIVLQRFAFEFEEKDHKLRSLGVWPSGDKIHATLADANGDDPFRFSAAWVDVPNGWLSQSPRLVSKKTDCKGVCNVPFAKSGFPKPRVLLSGFKFHRPSGDRNIQRIAIRPNTAESNFEVTFKDGGNASDNPFSIEITYAVVGAQRCLQYASASGNRKKKEPSISLKAAEGPKAISGFDVRFATGDHHLKRFGVSSAGAGFTVHLNDKNLDDEASAIIDYCVLADAGEK